jgi:hypothetical protein
MSSCDSSPEHSSGSPGVTAAPRQPKASACMPQILTLFRVEKSRAKASASGVETELR